MSTDEVPDELTVLVWAPRGRDATLAVDLLQRSGFTALVCEHVADIARLYAKAGCAVLTEEALHPQTSRVLMNGLTDQPAWSDFPFILFAPRNIGGVADALEGARVLGNVTILERPVQSRTLVSAVVAALRGRRRQYEARTAIQRRDEFLAMLGHELRNPLASIVLAIEALHQQIGGAAARPRAILERQAQHLARLVEDLLDVARVTTGKITLKKQTIDLSELLARCIQSIEARAKERGTDVVLDGKLEGALVDGDPVRLEEVFCNLMSNAIKYSPPKSRVDIALRKNDGHYEVEVTDRGIGIAPEVLPRVFELFMQADATMDRSQGGLGIGLTVVKSLVELHRGTVSASSAGKGKGSTFRVELPASNTLQRTPSQEMPEEEPIANLRVLVVEDNADLLELTCEALQAAGCKVMTATDGHKGIEMLKQHEFDVALVDIGLPGIDGYELARRARANGQTPRMVAMSGYGQDRDRERALAAGFDQHLTKPVSINAILRATRG